MPEIVYVEASGTEHRIEVPIGTTIMQGPVDHAVPGIEGDCGGLDGVRVPMPERQY